MKTSGFTILLLAALLSACHDSDNVSYTSNPPPIPIPNPVEPPPYDMNDMSNYIAAGKYEQRYNNLVENCGSDSAPQYQCSGLLFRVFVSQLSRSLGCTVKRHRQRRCIFCLYSPGSEFQVTR